MRAIYFNIGATEPSINIMAKSLIYEKEIMSNKYKNDYSGYSGSLGASCDLDDIYIKRNKMFLDGKEYCDFMVDYLTLDAKNQARANAQEIFEYLKGEENRNIYVYLPSQVGPFEVLTFVYNAFENGGKQLLDDHICYDERICDYKSFRDNNGDTLARDKCLHKRYSAGVNEFLEYISQGDDKTKDERVAIIIGGDEVFDIIKNNKKITKKCFILEPLETSNGKGGLTPMILSETVKASIAQDSITGETVDSSKLLK